MGGFGGCSWPRSLERANVSSYYIIHSRRPGFLVSLQTSPQLEVPCFVLHIWWDTPTNPVSGCLHPVSLTLPVFSLCVSRDTPPRQDAVHHHPSNQRVAHAGLWFARTRGKGRVCRTGGRCRPLQTPKCGHRKDSFHDILESEGEMNNHEEFPQPREGRLRLFFSVVSVSLYVFGS